MIDGYIKTSYPEDGAPLAVENAAERIVANIIAQARLRRQTAVINIDEYSQRLIPDTVFTKAIKDDLNPYVKSEGATKSNARVGTMPIAGPNSPRPSAYAFDGIELSVEAVNALHPLTEPPKFEDVWEVPE